jgi:hypothetical protein
MIQVLKEAKKDQKIIDKSANLKIEQKNELRLVHSEIFGSQDHIFLSSKDFLDPEVALYEYHTYQLGKMTFQCAGAKTLINYMPLNINLCIEKKSENEIDIEETIKKYIKLLMELNDDLPLD